MSHHILMSGATGFLGRRLLRTWLRRSSARVTVLVRSKNSRDLQNRAEFGINGDDPKLMEAFEKRVDLLVGDLTKSKLGLTASKRSELTGQITQIIHCGGLVSFKVPIEVARRTNADGTAAMLDLAGQCSGLRRFDHISTAFVAGRRRGTVYEDELDCGQEHNSGYERSKFEAEVLVRQASKTLPTTIHRPSIITCETETGEVALHAAFGRLLASYARGDLTRIPGRPGTRLDLVPVDFVANAVFAITQSEKSIGHCFHLAAGPDLSPTLTKVRDLTAKHFSRPPLAIDAPSTSGNHTILEAKDEAVLSQLLEEIALYEPYLTSEITFDTTRASSVLRATGIDVPDLAEYIGVMARFVSSLARSPKTSDSEPV